MGKKAFEFKAQQMAQHTKPPRKSKKKKKKGRKTPLDFLVHGAVAMLEKLGAKSTAPRNASLHAKRKGGAKLEDSATGKPSRKSTRGSEGRGKTDSALEKTKTWKTTSPQQRASRNTTGKKANRVTKSRSR